MPELTSRVYAEFGVDHCWYVDPLAKTLEGITLTDSKCFIAATFKSAEAVAAPQFAEDRFSLDKLWPPKG